jgi:tetratricopeptide (TPR) repeat protein
VLLEAVNRFESAGAWNLLASFYRSRREPHRALAAIEEVVQADRRRRRARALHARRRADRHRRVQPRHAVADGLTRTDYAQLLRGRILLTQGNPAGALAEFEKGLRAWPNNASARFLAGLAARDLGDWDRAISELRESVRANNAETDAALELARIYFERAQYQEAVAFAQQALSGAAACSSPSRTRSPRAPGPSSASSSARASRSRRSRSAASAARRCTSASTSRRARPGLRARSRSRSRATSIPRIRLDRSAAAGGRPLDPREARRRSARDDRPRARSRAEDRRPVRAARARARFAREGRDARKAYERALELDPASARANAGIAALRAKAGDSKGAIELFDRAYQLDPSEGDYGYAGAQLVLESGDTDGAATRLRELVKRHPGAAGARNDLAWLLAGAAKSSTSRSSSRSRRSAATARRPCSTRSAGCTTSEASTPTR